MKVSSSQVPVEPLAAGPLTRPLPAAQLQPPAVAACLRAAAEGDREVLDKGVRAFVSYLRAYREHHCRCAGGRPVPGVQKASEPQPRSGPGGVSRLQVRVQVTHRPVRRGLARSALADSYARCTACLASSLALETGQDPKP